MADEAGTTQTTSPAQRFALGAGVVYLIIGIVGFAATGVSHFASVSGHQLLVFGINPLHNLIHLAAGGSWLAASRKAPVARRVNVWLAAVFAILTGLGFAGYAGILAIEPADADNFLHLATAALALYFGTLGSWRLDPLPEPSSTHPPS